MRASFAKNSLLTFCFAESCDDPGGKGALEMRFSFLYFFSLVRISVRTFLAHLRAVCAFRILGRPWYQIVSRVGGEGEQKDRGLCLGEPRDLTEDFHDKVTL